MRPSTAFLLAGVAFATPALADTGTDGTSETTGASAVAPAASGTAAAAATATATNGAGEAGQAVTLAALPQPDPAELSAVTIVGSSSAARDIGGSAHFIGPDELEEFDYADIHRILRAVPGVYLQDEEGFGHRPNIGIRGSGQDRSSRIAILEDGVLIAPAPYAAPAAYYFPNARRIYAAEVLKGPSSISVGPRTIGGAVNLLSAPIPNDFGLYADYYAGQNGSQDARPVHFQKDAHRGKTL